MPPNHTKALLNGWWKRLVAQTCLRLPARHGQACGRQAFVSATGKARRRASYRERQTRMTACPERGRRALLESEIRLSLSESS